MIGQTLGSYRIVEQVGMGGMATVYKAYDPGTDRYVAIKILPAHYSQDPTFRERFRREAKAIARLEHPHILPIHAYGEEGDTAYLLMRFLPTGTLKQRIERGALQFGEVGAILTQVADAMDYAHELGILHRDIKPSNVLLDEKGNAYLSDFGIAKMVGTAGDLTGTGMLGTPAYMSPEQCAGSRDLSPASDQYALGVVLYEMVTGRTPFQAETPLALIQMHLSAPLPPPHLLRPDLPEAVEGVILKALSRGPQDRWTTCSEMADAFNRAIGESGIAAYTPPMRSGETTAEGVELTFGETIPAPPLTVKAKKGGLPVWMMGLTGALVIGLIIGGLALAGVFGATPATDGTQVGGAEATTAVNTSAPEVAGPANNLVPTATLTALQQGEWLEDCNNDLCLVSGKDGSTSLGLGATYTNFYGFSWSPDRSRIVFNACLLQDFLTNPSSSCDRNLYVSNLDGSDPLMIARGNDSNAFAFPAWSPDGEWVVFGRSGGIEIIHPDGTDNRALTSSSPVTAPGATAWSPDSLRIAWVGGNCQDCAQDRVFHINQDASDFRALFYSPDMRIESKIAWSPDGQSVAIELENGAAYLIDANCQSSGLDGCEESSRTKLDSFPEHWLHTFHPQWVGEFDEPAPTATPASAGEAFAAPILAAIADRPPDFEDDFSTSVKGWLHYETFSNIEDGVLKISVPEGEDFGASSHTQLWASDFVFQVDVRANTIARDASINIILREAYAAGPTYYISFYPQFNGAWRIYDSGDRAEVAGGNIPTLIAIGQWSNILVIARGAAFAIFVNDTLVDYFRDETVPEGQNALQVFGQPGGKTDVDFDNVKFWNLANVPDLP